MILAIYSGRHYIDTRSGLHTIGTILFKLSQILTLPTQKVMTSFMNNPKENIHE